jgi:hypothetical protein
MIPHRLKVWGIAAVLTATAVYLYWQGMQSGKLTSRGGDSTNGASDAHLGWSDPSAIAADAQSSTELRHSPKSNPATVIASIGDGSDADPIVKQSAVSITGPTLLLGTDAGSNQANNNSADPLNRPRGWKVTGAQASNCILESDFNYVQSGRASALLQTITNDPVSHCGIGQVSAVGKFRGQRVAFSAFLATQNVTGGGALWFRADAGSGAVVAFQSLLSTGIKGTSPWTLEVLVIDIPETAESMFYGASLGGSGMLWVDSADFNIVDMSVAVTGPTFSPAAYSGKTPLDLTRIPAAPHNLNFEETVPLDQ